PVTHGAQFALETGDGGIVKFSFPMEGRRTIVSQQLSREALMDGLGKLPGLVYVGLRSFAPDHVGVGSVDQAASNGCFESAFEAQKAVGSALAREEIDIANIAVAGKQLGAIGIGAGN